MAKSRAELEQQLERLTQKQAQAIEQNADRGLLITISNAILETEYQLERVKTNENL